MGYDPRRRVFNNKREREEKMSEEVKKKPRKPHRKISVKVEEQLEKSKTRPKIIELSYNEERLPTEMRFQVTEIRRELGIQGTIAPKNIKTIDGIYRYWSKNKKRLLKKKLPWEKRHNLWNEVER
tara:strand:- start:471 stop:845 length:375 start_codon:yes stop_codon:yes gene_type:complete